MGHSLPTVVALACSVSVLLGLGIYTVLLRRPQGLTLTRDGVYVLCFALCGLGYAAARALIDRLGLR